MNIAYTKVIKIMELTNIAYYPEEAPYCFGPFSTYFHETSFAGYQDLRRQAIESGWYKVKLEENLHPQRDYGIKVFQWLYEHNMKPLNILCHKELWFDREEDAILFKLTWC